MTDEPTEAARVGAFLDPFVSDVGRRLLLAEPGAPTSPRDLECDGTVLWADIGGFTALTERYDDRGAEGTERLRSLINAIFSRLVDSIGTHGGDVLLFAGDGVLALFPLRPGEPPGDDARRAARCALGMQTAVDVTEEGRIEIKVGLASGPMQVSLIGGVDHHWHVLSVGAPLVDVKTAEEQAERGQVVLAPSALERLADAVTSTPIGEGYAVLTTMASTNHEPATMASPDTPDLPHTPVVAELARLLVPPGIEDALATGRADWLAETRRITAVFVNVADIGAAAPTAEVHDALRKIQQSVSRFGGVVLHVSFSGSGMSVLAAFGLPLNSHEDDVHRALLAGDSVRREFQDSEHRVVIGLASGRVLCGTMGSQVRQEYTIIGGTVNLAARLMQGALKRLPPGAGRPVMWCDAETSRRAGDSFTFSPLPPLPVKGRSEPVSLSRVGAAPTRSRAAAYRPASSVIGREREFVQLASVADEWARGARSHLLIEGDAGVGKSELVAALDRRLGERNLARLAGAGDAIESSSPYFAWRPVFGEILGIDHETDASSGRWLVEWWIQEHAPELADLLPLVGAVTPFDIADTEPTATMQGKVRADETTALLVAVLRHATAGSPTVLSFEDAHWFDSATWALLGQVINHLPNISLVVTSRPPGNTATESGESALAAFRSGPGVTSIELTGLGEDAVVRLAARELGVDDLPPEVARFVTDRTGGNPFFVQEFARALRDTGAIEIAGGTCRVTDPSGTLAAAMLPDTVHATIISRIDRLAPRQALAIKVASILGQEFSYGLLAAIHPVPEDLTHLRDDLEAVIGLDLLRPRGPGADDRYRFTHALTRDVVASLLLNSQRHGLHRSVAECLEHDPDAANAATIAYHWTMSTRAGGGLDAAARMTQWAMTAGGTHLRDNALVESAAVLQGALDAIAEVPDGPERDALELPLRVLHAIPLTLTGGWASPRVIETYTRAQALCTRIGPGPQLFPTLVGVFTYYLVRGQFARAYEMAIENDRIARASGDRVVTVEGAHDLGTSSFYVGRFDAALEHCTRVEEIYDPSDHQTHTQLYGKDPYATALGHKAMTLAMTGRPDQALTLAQRAVDHTRTWVHPFSHVWALTTLAIVHQLRDEPAEMATVAATMIPMCHEHGFPWLAQALAWQGWARARAGEADAGVADIRQGLAIWEMTGSQLVKPYLRAILADAMLRTGDTAGATEQVQQGLVEVAATGEFGWEPLLLRVRGDIASLEAGAGAAAWYRRAIERASALGADLVTLQALDALAARGEITDDEGALRDELQRSPR